MNAPTGRRVSRGASRPEASHEREVARGDALGELQQVGLDAPVEREHPAGAAEAGDHFVGGEQRVEQALEQTAAVGVRVKAPKTRNGRRSISLPASVVTELRAHWRPRRLILRSGTDTAGECG
jgi:hypothetical protein